MTNQSFTSTCPASGEVVWAGPVASRDAVLAAVSAARKSLPAWRSTAIENRTGVARAFAGVLKSRTSQLAELISRETGKPLWEARQEVGSMVAKVESSISAQAERTGERRSPTPFGEAVLRHRPHGVMAVLGPYNFPGHLPNGHIVPALLAGNVVVFKPSELTPAVGELMVEAWTEAGLPHGVLTIVQGGRETGEALVTADLDGLLFTGSAATGMQFRRLFAERPSVVLALELGGNNPLIVWDGDVDEAAAVAVQSAYVTTGQRCSCARRLILPHGPFGDAVIDAIASLADRLPIGQWSDVPEPYMGPLVSVQAATTARSQVDRLLDLGARDIRPLGTVAERAASFVNPALIDVTDVDAPDEEIFAPVLQVIRAPDFDGAVTAANRTRFGLSAALVTQDDALWERFLVEARAGVVNRNRPSTGAAGQMPFGGIGESGNHRPSAYYAADYCAYPVASFEASTALGNRDLLAASVRS